MSDVSYLISYLNLPVSRLRKGDIGEANTSL